jgi:hypothetical protein
MKPEPLEKYTSALTLSDMEIFVFPELMYSLLLANLMSPILWQWRRLDCFKKLEGKSHYRKLMRLKQFIIDEFEFNLDLETWGLTSKDKGGAGRRGQPGAQGLCVQRRHASGRDRRIQRQ